MVRCCVGDGGVVALRRRPVGGGVKPPRAALAEDFVNMNVGSETEMKTVGGLADCGAGWEMEVAWPSGAVVRTEAPNHHEGRWLVTVVLSVVGKARL
jgi:hypothetical protein